MGDGVEAHPRDDRRLWHHGAGSRWRRLAGNRLPPPPRSLGAGFGDGGGARVSKLRVHAARRGLSYFIDPPGKYTVVARRRAQRDDDLETYDARESTASGLSHHTRGVARVGRSGLKCADSSISPHILLPYTRSSIFSEFAPPFHAVLNC